jgi:two-component system phosphate regulon response regulator PhoB
VRSRLAVGGDWHFVKIMVIDNDATSAAAVREAVDGPGRSVLVVGSAEEGLARANLDRPDLVIVEMRLPDLSGIGLCRAIREHPDLGNTPILMLSASAAEIDRVLAFEVGVDDFLAKPFNARELSLRAQAIFRRTSKRVARGEGGLLQAGPLVLDAAQHSVRVEGREVSLTVREFDVLAAILRGQGRVLGRRQILESVWGDGSGKTPRVVDTHVKWIRRKLGPAGSLIETMRGVGYRLADDAPGRGPVARAPLREPAA